jgi:hypothetical protein
MPFSHLVGYIRNGDLALFVISTVFHGETVVYACRKWSMVFVVVGVVGTVFGILGGGVSSRSLPIKE